MDARITKQRLGNMLSYDWLKILLTVAAAVAVLVILFTMIATRPTDAQTFLIYAYYDVSAGSDYNNIEKDVKSGEGGVFSYDILKVGSELFREDGMYSAQVFSMRRSAMEGTVMFVAHDMKNDAEGNPVMTRLDQLTAAGLIGENGKDAEGLLRDPEKLMEECEAYLQGFFDGEEFVEENLVKEKVRECFLARNGGDKRFRSSAKKEAGILQERARILKLRDDYAAVKAAFDGGDLTYTQSTVNSFYFEDEKVTFTVGINLGKLNGIENLFYYQKEGSDKREKENLNLVIFNNGERNGMSDLKFEAISYLRYLLDKYSPNAAEAE